MITIDDKRPSRTMLLGNMMKGETFIFNHEGKSLLFIVVYVDKDSTRCVRLGGSEYSGDEKIYGKMTMVTKVNLLVEIVE